MTEAEIISAIRDVLVREYELDDVKESFDALLSAGEDVSPHILSTLLECADGKGKGSWWYGADKLCKALSGLKTENAKNALLTILKTDSRMAEFDKVRYQAAEELATFKDPRIIPDLTETPTPLQATFPYEARSSAVTGVLLINRGHALSSGLWLPVL